MAQLESDLGDLQERMLMAIAGELRLKVLASSLMQLSLVGVLSPSATLVAICGHPNDRNDTWEIYSSSVCEMQRYLAWFLTEITKF